MTITITTEQAVESLRKAVEKRGEDFVYTESKVFDAEGYCYLDPQGQPSCIVGHVLYDAGLRDLSLFEQPFQAGEFGIGLLNDTKFRDVAHLLPIEISPALHEYLWGIQREQDAGAPWGRAVTGIQMRPKS